MVAYGGELTPLAFIDRFAALIALRLFQLPLRLARSVRHLIKSGEQSEDMVDVTAGNPLELYCDFTTVRGSASDELARQAVQRDLEIMQGFGADRLLLYSLFQAMPNLRKKGEEITNLPMADSLVAMLRERENPMVSTYAVYSMQEIENETRDNASGTDDDLDFISTVMDSELPPIEQLTTLLIEGLATKSLQNQARWFWSTGGIKKPYGLITGSLNSRRSWRYAPSDDLLQALLLVCFTAANGTRYRPRMPIEKLLEILRDRFGILVNQPPAALNSADNRAAAAVNLEAFKRRLRLLGCFDGLSDDFFGPVRPQSPGDSVSEGLPSVVIERVAARLERRLAARLPGHCVRVDDLTVDDALAIAGQIAGHSAAFDVYVLAQVGQRHLQEIRVDRAIELRNRKQRPLLLLVPAGAGHAASSLDNSFEPLPLIEELREVSDDMERELAATEIARLVGDVKHVLGRTRQVESWARFLAGLVANPAADTVGRDLWQVGLVPDRGGDGLDTRLLRNKDAVAAISLHLGRPLGSSNV